MAGWHTYIPSVSTKEEKRVRFSSLHIPPNTIPVPSSDDDVQPRPSLPAQSPALGRIKSGRYQDKLKKLTLQTWGKMHQAKRIPNIHVR